MADEWREERLSALCAYLKRGAAPAYTDCGGILVLNQKCIRDQRVSFDEGRRTDTEKKPVTEERMLKPFDILVNSTGVGTLGRVAQLRELPEPATVDGHVTVIRPDPLAVEPVYLGMALRCFESDLEALGEGSTGQTELPRSRLGAFTVPVPSRNEQRAIAHILGTLDDKIELNRRMNETLEAMARALFKSWFVDFDPVRAKAEGRDLGLPQSLADFFPDSFKDSELGEIPRGWEVGTLADLASLNPESWSKETRPPEIKYIDLSNTKWGRIEAVTPYAASDAPSRAQRVLRPGDTIVGTVRPGNGSYAFIWGEGLTGSTGFAVLRPRAAQYAGFVYLAATAADNIDALQHLADGGAYPAVRPEIVAATSIVRPDDKLLGRFSLAVRPLLAKLAESEQESLILAALRDALLPKLISGELRVKDAEPFIERVSHREAGVQL
jgi:type I restriction enzyme S subunit